MAGWEWLLDGAGVLLLVVLLYGLLLVVRRRVLCRNGGTFELSVRVRPAPQAGRGWVLGLGRYQGDVLEWFRIFSPAPRPARVFARFDTHIVGQREPEGEEAFALYDGHLVVECETPGGTVSLGMSPSALTGFSAWLEAGPPGADWDRGPRR